MIAPSDRRQTPRHERQTEGFTDERFAAIAQIVYVVTGLVFPPNRQPTAEAGMRRTMATLRLSRPEQLVEAIGAPGEARDSLIAELTVGESYFFREWGPLALLESEILPRRAPNAPLSFWSAGCASGEEPHSLAIRMAELGALANTRILGTDIALPRLAAARKGRYTAWALRGVSDERISRWFNQRAKQYILDENIRSSVTFERLNFADKAYAVAGAGHDLVLCRNVLIYFEMETVAEIACRLLETLSTNGWLLLGASDPPIAELVECQSVLTPHGMAYRRIDAVATQYPATNRDVLIHDRPSRTSAPPRYAVAELQRDVPVAPQYVPLAAPAPRPVRVETPQVALKPVDYLTLYKSGDYGSAEAAAQKTLELNGADANAWIVLIRSLANRGDLAAASRHVSSALNAANLVPELHYLEGLLFLEAGRASDAIASARRALYLDRSMVMAYMLLADAAQQMKDPDTARRASVNALSLLSAAPADTEIPASDGVSQSRLEHIARERLRRIPVSA